MPRSMSYSPSVSGRTGSNRYYNQDGPGNTTIDYGPHGPRDPTPSFTPTGPGYAVPYDMGFGAEGAAQHAQNRAAMAADPAYASAAARGDIKGALARQVQMKQDAQRQRFIDQGGQGSTWDNRYANENNWPRPTSSIGYSHGPGRPDFATRGTNPSPYGPGNTAPPPAGRAGAMSYNPAASTGMGEAGGDAFSQMDPNGFVSTQDWGWDPQNRQWMATDWGGSNSLADYAEVAGSRPNGTVVPWDPSMGYAPPSSPGGRYDASIAGTEPAGSRDWWNTDAGASGLAKARAKAGKGPATNLPTFTQFTGKPMPDVKVDGYQQGAAAPQARTAPQATTARRAQADIARVNPVSGLPTGPRTPAGPYTPTTVDPSARMNDLMALYGLGAGGMNASPFGMGNFGASGGGPEGFAALRGMMAPPSFAAPMGGMSAGLMSPYGMGMQSFRGYQPAMPQGMMYAY